MIVVPAVMFLLIGFNAVRTQPVQYPPRIVKQPDGNELYFQAYDDENPFYIECEAIGETSPRYRWTKNGKPFYWRDFDDRITQQIGRGTLVFLKPEAEDAGQYQCFAENGWGVATSNSINLRKYEFKSFKRKPPLTVHAKEGHPFHFPCEAPEGTPKPTVRWFVQYDNGRFESINNSRITPDPEGNLWFANVTREDASEDFKYVCGATSIANVNEFKLGDRVELKVDFESTPPIKHAPSAQYTSRKFLQALKGKSVELYCIFSGTLPLQIVWSKDGSKIQFSNRVYQKNYGKTLFIELVDFADEGEYTCDVSNGVGENKSHSTNLIVTAQPYFIEEPEAVTAADGETVQFHCEAGGIPKPCIKWTYNGKPLAEAPANSRRKIETNTITYENVNKGDTGNYGCNATNLLGYVYKDVYIDVFALPPRIIEFSEAYASVDGDNVKLTCRTFGSPKPEVKWYHNGKQYIGENVEILNTGDLLIKQVQNDNRGQYICNAKNKFGSINKTATFEIKAHTEIQEGPNDSKAGTGTEIRFPCTVRHDTDLDVEVVWLMDFMEIDFEEQPRFVKASDYSLTISNITQLDSGVYTCRAQTSLDTAEASALLVVQDEPNPPLMEQVQCHEKHAIINWRTAGHMNSPILNYTIQYSTSFLPATWEVIADGIPPDDTSFQVSLSPWANYTFRVVAFNKFGYSAPSQNSAVCTTGKEVPYKNPDNVSSSSSEPNSLIISWTPMPQIEHNAPRFYYRVYWKIENGRNSDYSVQDIFDWKQDRTIIHNVPPSSRFLIKVIALNELGEPSVYPKFVTAYTD